MTVPRRRGAQAPTLGYEDVLDAVDQGVVVQDADGRIVAINRSACERFGVEPDGVTGRTPGELGWVPSDDDGRVVPVDERPSSVAVRTGAPVVGEVCLEVPGRARQWLELTSRPMEADSGAGARLVVTTIRDVTDRRLADERLRYQIGLLDSTGQAAIGAAADGTVVYWNRAAEELFGWSAEEAMGRPAIAVTAPPDGGSAVQVLDTLAAGETWRGDLCCRRKDGALFDALVTASPVVDHGRVVGMIGVASDITERKREEEAFRHLSAIVESSRDAIVGHDLDGTVSSWNGAAEALYGWSADEAVGRHVSLLVPADRVEELDGVLTELRTGRATNALETQHRRKDGSLVDVSITVSPVVAGDGTVGAGATIARDISERRALERVLAEDRERLAEAQRVAHLGSWEHEPDADTTQWSSELHRILGLDVDVAPSLTRYLDTVHPADRLEVLIQWNRVTVDRGDMQTTHRVIRPDGEVRWVDARAWRTPTGLIRGTLLDITERTRAEVALSHQALHDPLSGLPNRLLVTDRLDQALARAERRRTRVAVLFLDLDRFKVVNDGMGHAAGDALLVAVADRLRTRMRPSDTLARFGADEFVVVCDDVVGAWDADALGRRVAGALDDPFRIADRELYVSASVGVTLSEAGATAEGLLREAEAAMYRAKHRGRGRLELADAARSEQAAARLELESGLRRALERDELWVAYQPIVGLDGGRPVGVEALLRWARPDRSTVPPDEFIPIAEDTGLIVPVGRWVLRRALRDLAALRAADDALAGLFMAVNVSGRQLLTTDLLPVVVEELDRAGVEASALHLEVTESVLMDDVEHSIEVLAALRDVGVSLAVDDFGTGYSSLSYLKRLPLDTLKVDRSFVAGLGVDPNDSSIVDAITGLGRALGIVVLAEGVEDDRQRARLIELGCHLAQGFLWSRPAPVETAARWLVEAVRH